MCGLARAAPGSCGGRARSRGRLALGRTEATTAVGADAVERTAAQRGLHALLPEAHRASGPPSARRGCHPLARAAARQGRPVGQTETPPAVVLAC